VDLVIATGYALGMKGVYAAAGANQHRGTIHMYSHSNGMRLLLLLDACFLLVLFAASVATVQG
jgi:hypothetical protein